MDTDRVLEAPTVVIRDGRIAEVGPSAEVAVPEGALIIDGTGRFLMPGLAEMHAHVPVAQASAELGIGRATMYRLLKKYDLAGG